LTRINENSFAEPIRKGNTATGSQMLLVRE